MIPVPDKLSTPSLSTADLTSSLILSLPQIPPSLPLVCIERIRPYNFLTSVLMAQERSNIDQQRLPSHAGATTAENPPGGRASQCTAAAEDQAVLINELRHGPSPTERDGGHALLNGGTAHANQTTQIQPNSTNPFTTATTQPALDEVLATTPSLHTPHNPFSAATPAKPQVFATVSQSAVTLPTADTVSPVAAAYLAADIRPSSHAADALPLLPPVTAPGQEIAAVPPPLLPPSSLAVAVGPDCVLADTPQPAPVSAQTGSRTTAAGDRLVAATRPLPPSTRPMPPLAEVLTMTPAENGDTIASTPTRAAVTAVLAITKAESTRAEYAATGTIPAVAAGRAVRSEAMGTDPRAPASAGSGMPVPPSRQSGAEVEISRGPQIKVELSRGRPKPMPDTTILAATVHAGIGAYGSTPRSALALVGDVTGVADATIVTLRDDATQSTAVFPAGRGPPIIEAPPSSACPQLTSGIAPSCLLGPETVDEMVNSAAPEVGRLAGDATLRIAAVEVETTPRSGAVPTVTPSGSALTEGAEPADTAIDLQRIFPAPPCLEVRDLSPAGLDARTNLTEFCVGGLSGSGSDMEGDGVIRQAERKEDDGSREEKKEEGEEEEEEEFFSADEAD